MKVEQTNFVTHLIITAVGPQFGLIKGGGPPGPLPWFCHCTVRLYYWLSQNLSVKIWSNNFQMVMINLSMCMFKGKSNDRILCKLSKSEILRLFWIVHVAMETTKTSHFTCQTNFSPVYFSLAKFQLVSCNVSLAMIWQITYTHKLPKLCSATLTLVSTPFVN